MTQEDAIRKAMACLRLAKSSNANEAALAAAKAQEIIEKFKLDVNSLEYDQFQAKEDAEPIKDFGYSDPLDNADWTNRIWSLRLASVVSRANQCRVVYYRNGATGGFCIKIIGRPSDVQTVRYVYAYFRGETMRLCKENCAGNSGTFKEHYRRGVVDAISEKLREQRERTQREVRAENSNNPLALVRVNNAIARLEKRGDEVQKFMDETMKLGRGRGMGAGHSFAGASARQQGYRDGQGIRITSAKAGIGRGVAGTLS